MTELFRPLQSLRYELEPVAPAPRRELTAHLAERYGVSEQECGAIKTLTIKRLADYFAELAGLSESTPGVDFLDHLEGKRILDLGCGARSNVDGAVRNRRFEPWLCRGLLAVGAHPVGVDIQSNDGELFEHYQADLTDPLALLPFEDGSFDAVVSECMFGMGAGSSPTLLGALSNQGTYLEGFETGMLQHMQRLVRDPGVVIATAQTWFRQGGETTLVDDIQVPVRQLRRTRHLLRLGHP